MNSSSEVNKMSRINKKKKSSFEFDYVRYSYNLLPIAKECNFNILEPKY